jgi:class 3 adenylate cyclase
MTRCFLLLIALLSAAVSAAGFAVLRYRRRVGTLERELDEEKARLVDCQFEMAEKSINLLSIKEKLEEEEARSQRLLRNILPERVIVELRETGVSQPECFEEVTVFFSDIVDFTASSATMSPAELIAELSDIFSQFDRIFVKNGCERIKTIGDAYMSVSGLSTPDPEHAGHILDAALGVRAYLIERNRTARFRWQMRFGIHSGAVTGGIVGTEKYIYDIFGDTVNTASRMEKYSEPMRIRLSEATMKLTADRFDFSDIGEIEVKGKGMMKSGFLDGRKPGPA